MTDTRSTSIWDYCTMTLWSVTFAFGLVPEFVFHGFRAIGGVTTRDAMVNSSAVITLGLAAYIAFFVIRQCRATGLDTAEAQGRGIQAALLSMIAFLEIPTQSAVFGTQTLLGIVWNSAALPTTELKVIIWIVGICKILAWAYLYGLMVQFHLFGNRNAFNGMHMFIFRSTDETPPEKPSDAAATPDESEETPTSE